MKRSLGLLLVFSTIAASSATAADDPLAAAVAKVHGEYAAKFAVLADWSREQHLPAEADRTVEWNGPRDPRKCYVYRPADRLAAPPELSPEWAKKFLDTRKAYAAALFALAGKAPMHTTAGWLMN